jgi:hypothetical protein
LCRSSFSAAFEDEEDDSEDAYGEVDEEGGGPARLSRSSAISSRFDEAMAVFLPVEMMKRESGCGVCVPSESRGRRQ